MSSNILYDASPSFSARYARLNKEATELSASKKSEHDAKEKESNSSPTPTAAIQDEKGLQSVPFYNLVQA
jgi:hypothetical protein